MRNSYSGIVLGGQLDGIRGDIASPRLKTATLCALTMQMIVLGHSATAAVAVYSGIVDLCAAGHVYHDTGFS